MKNRINHPSRTDIHENGLKTQSPKFCDFLRKRQVFWLTPVLENLPAIFGSGIEVFRTIGSLQQRRLLRILTEFPIMPNKLVLAPLSKVKLELLDISDVSMLKMTI